MNELITAATVATALKSSLVEKAYDDMLSPFCKEIGALGGDLGKAARLLIDPLQIATTFQDRLKCFFTNLNARVPEERRVPIPAEISGPSLQAMQYLELENPLWKMFEELLIKSADSESASKAHPSFAHIIKQLSRDEAFILHKLTQGAFEFIGTMDLDHTINRFINKKYEKWSFPSEELFVPDAFGLYYNHLESLSLVRWPIYNQEPIFDSNHQQTGTREFSRIHLTEFGILFTEACIPQNGFSNSENEEMPAMP